MVQLAMLMPQVVVLKLKVVVLKLKLMCLKGRRTISDLVVVELRRMVVVAVGTVLQPLMVQVPDQFRESVVVLPHSRWLSHLVLVVLAVLLLLVVLLQILVHSCCVTLWSLTGGSATNVSGARNTPSNGMCTLH